MKVRRRYHPKSGDIYYTVGYSKVLHREGGPAVIKSSGSRYWFRYGKIHRVGGPAMESHYGTDTWYKDGYRHRVDGPASIHNTYGPLEWCIDGTCFKNKEDWFEALTPEQQQKMLFSEYFIN